MRVRVSDPGLTASLEHYLVATECLVQWVNASELDVSMPRAPTDEQARREIAIYLKAWETINAPAMAGFVD
jgi:hypothetical protein